MNSSGNVPPEGSGCPLRVLVVTGSMLTPKEPSLLKALRKQVEAVKASSGAWLDIEVKIQALAHILAARAFRKSQRFARAPYRIAVQNFFTQSAAESDDPPEVTEVILVTLLHKEGVAFEVATYAELYADDAKRDRLLAETHAVFASMTLLRDMSEVVPLVGMLKRPHNRVIAGGALAGILHHAWPGCTGLDILAVGYGELMVKELCDWMKGGFKDLQAPARGRVIEMNRTQIVYSGVPEQMDLDFLPSPDWELAMQVHDQRFTHVNYESARGCPYRCGFCNYPYLFDDTKFRYRSAKKIAEDWEHLYQLGVETITCLDSLFTMPRRRLIELCNLLIAREVRLKWIGYARADDLQDLEVCRLMKQAGCHQVQIGFESGSQRQLDNMNKHSGVAQNVRAMQNCREVGITTLATVLIGFPGETAESVRESFEILQSSPPDIYYVAPFNTRVEYVPILSPESRAKYGLRTYSDGRSSAPYWAHDSMSCTEVVDHVEWFHRQMMEHRVALEGTLFYEGTLHYHPLQREALLDYQRDSLSQGRVLRKVLSWLRHAANARLRKDIARVFAAVSE